MPDIRDPNTVQAIAQGYMASDRGKEKGLIGAGFSESYARSKGMKLYDRPEVIEAIRRLEVKYAEENGYSVAACQAEYEQARQHAASLNQPSAEVSAITGKARLYALDQDKQVTGDVPAPVSAEQVDEFRAMARAATKLKLSKESA